MGLGRFPARNDRLQKDFVFRLYEGYKVDIPLHFDHVDLLALITLLIRVLQRSTSLPRTARSRMKRRKREMAPAASATRP